MRKATSVTSSSLQLSLRSRGVRCLRVSSIVPHVHIPPTHSRLCKSTIFSHFSLFPKNTLPVESPARSYSTGAQDFVPKALFSPEDYRELNGELFIHLALDPVETHQGEEPWEHYKLKLSDARVYAFALHALDRTVAPLGFLSYFYMYQGAFYEDVVNGLNELRDPDMLAVYMNATRVIELKQHWKLFERLISIEGEWTEEDLEDNRTLEEALKPLHEEYLARREMTMKRLESYMRVHKNLFFE